MIRDSIWRKDEQETFSKDAQQMDKEWPRYNKIAPTTEQDQNKEETPQIRDFKLTVGKGSLFAEKEINLTEGHDGSLLIEAWGEGQYITLRLDAEGKEHLKQFLEEG